MNLERALLRKVGQAIGDFRMIRQDDRIAVALSGGKDSLTLLEVLLRLQARAPVSFQVCAFTIEQGKFLRPLDGLAAYLEQKGIEWTCFQDGPSLRVLTNKPEHGCDLCSRYRRRAVYEVARGLKANVIAFGHTADDFCEALLRNALFTGRISALPPVTYSSRHEFRLIRPLVYVTEDMTRRFAERLSLPVTPCACAQRGAGVRQAMRDLLANLEKQYPHLRQKLIGAMGNLDTGRLLDRRFLGLEDEPRAVVKAASPAES